MRKRQLPVKCQFHHLLHVRDCLINKGAERPQVHLSAKEELQKKDGWYMPRSCELTYQAGGMFLPHTLKKHRPNQYFCSTDEKKYISSLQFYFSLVQLKMLKKCRQYCKQHVSIAFRDCSKIIRQGRGDYWAYIIIFLAESRGAFFSHLWWLFHWMFYFFFVN